jgi:phosphoglycolate phosphatase
MLLATHTRLGVAPADTVMIGDRVANVGTARAADVPVIAVSFGYMRTAPLELAVDAVVDHLCEVLAATARLRA